MRRAALLVIALGARTVPAVAQTCSAPVPAGSCSATTSMSIGINTVVRLTLSGTTTTLTPPGVADYDAGFVANTGPTATVQANKSWTLQISSLTANWVASGGARANKPASDLTWAKASGGPFVGMTTSPATVVLGTPSAGSATTIFFKTLYAWNLDTPGTYSLTVVLTLTSR